MNEFLKQKRKHFWVVCLLSFLLLAADWLSSSKFDIRIAANYVGLINRSRLWTTANKNNKQSQKEKKQETNFLFQTSKADWEHKMCMQAQKAQKHMRVYDKKATLNCQLCRNSKNRIVAFLQNERKPNVACDKTVATFPNISLLHFSTCFSSSVVVMGNKQQEATDETFLVSRVKSTRMWQANMNFSWCSNKPCNRLANTQRLVVFFVAQMVVAVLLLLFLSH